MLRAACAQLLNGLSGDRGGSPRKPRLVDRELGELFRCGEGGQDERTRGGMDEGVGGLGGKAGELRVQDWGLLDCCECPGQAAPGNGAASATRIARAAEIALRFADPRIRGVDGEAGGTPLHELMALLSVFSAFTLAAGSVASCDRTGNILARVVPEPGS